MTLAIEPALEWLSLVELSGIYLAPMVLAEAYPQSLDPVQLIPGLYSFGHDGQSKVLGQHDDRLNEQSAALIVHCSYE